MMEIEPALSGVTNGEYYLNIVDNGLACIQEYEKLDDDIVEESVSKMGYRDESQKMMLMIISLFSQLSQIELPDSTFKTYSGTF